ncbi:GNAT family N-acetyltransferase [Alteromonas sp. CYL-A6]|uniref:GNAT family N-acetyltransferase n=1 Tax=Alteromonas nitratireducens TaxID=3390813 RepID=UPI0034C35721
MWQQISSVDSLPDLYPGWEQLLKRAACDPLFNSPLWVDTWIKHYWQPHWILKVNYAVCNDEVVAIVPLYVQPSSSALLPSVCFLLGQGEPEVAEIASEYQDVIVNPDYASALHKDIALFLTQAAGEFRGRALLSTSMVTAALSSLPCTTRHATRYIIDKTNWTRSLMTKNLRSQVKRAENKLKKTVHQFYWVHRDKKKQAFSQLARLHNKRWHQRSQTGAFSGNQFLSFHQNLIKKNDVTRLAVLAIEDEIICIHYYFERDNTLYFYQSGWDPDTSTHFSPGLLLHCWAIENTNCQYYDFMMGAENHSYKSRFGASRVPMVSITLPLSFVAKTFASLRHIKARLQGLKRPLADA